MKKTITFQVSLLVICALILKNSFAQGHSQTRTLEVPTLKETKTFWIYAKTGDLKVFNFTISSKAIRNEESRNFRNGELLFIMTGPNSAILSANTGVSKEVEVVGDSGALTFIETMPAGKKHVMIIQDEWDEKEGGFKFTYTRHSNHSKNIPEVRRFNYSGVAKPAGQYKSPQTSRETGPSLHTIRIFHIYAKKGNFETFSLESGELLKSAEARDLRNGELQYALTGPNSEIFSGNAGSDDVKLVKDERSLTFIETTPAGNKQVLIIKDKWDEKEKGFEFTYVRNTEDILILGKLMRSIYSGIAKPAM